jgi:NAD(P)-dependent dehydrogenase (short-subunit alcohol dehydrogenase family)
VVVANDEAGVDAHAQSVVDRGGSLDISFTSISRADVQGTPLVDMTADDYVRSIAETSRANFLTARAAARHMAAGSGGVILFLTSGSSRGTAPGMGNTGPADAAVEAFYRYLAAETGAQGVRVAGIHTAAVRETLTIEKMAEVNPAIAGADLEQIIAGIASMTMLKRAPELESVAETAAFLASDRARNITSGIVNATAGMIAG